MDFFYFVMRVVNIFLILLHLRKLLYVYYNNKLYNFFLKNKLIIFRSTNVTKPITIWCEINLKTLIKPKHSIDYLPQILFYKYITHKYITQYVGTELTRVD